MGKKGHRKKNEKQHEKPQELLIVNNLSKTYVGGKDARNNPIEVEALKRVDLSIYPGEFIAVVGVSGSGKSTLIHCLGSFEKPDRDCTDAIRFRPNGDYQNIWKNPTSYRQNFVGIVFQSFHLLPNMRVQQNIELPLKLYQCKRYSDDPRVRIRAVEAVLNRLGIGVYLNSRVEQLSGGECQRVAIARALIKEPRLLLADEPTGNLDEENKERIIRTLRDLAQGDVAVLMVTHDQRFAIKYADRIITLEDGRIVDERHNRPNLLSNSPVEDTEAVTAPTDRNDSEKADEIAQVHRVPEDRPSPSLAEKTDTPTNEPPVSCTKPPVVSQLQVKPGKSHVQNGSHDDETDIVRGTSDSPQRPEADQCRQAKEEQTMERPKGSRDGEWDTVEQQGKIQKSKSVASSSLATSVHIDQMIGTRDKARGDTSPSSSISGVKLLRRLRIPGFSQGVRDLISYATRDAVRTRISLGTNVFAIAIGTMLTALLISLLLGTRAYIDNVIPLIPGIDAVHITADYSTGATPISEQEVEHCRQWPNAVTVVPHIQQFVPMSVKPTRETMVTLVSTIPGDPEVSRLELLAGTARVDPDGWDVILPATLAGELSISYEDRPESLAGKQINLHLRRYAKTADLSQAKVTKELVYPVRVVGIIKKSYQARVYGSLNMVRFIRDFSTGRSTYESPASSKIDISEISDRTMFENVRIHFATPRKAESAFGELKKGIDPRLDVYWSGERILFWRDAQLVSAIVLVGIGLLTVVAGSVSIFNTLIASVARKTNEIGILRALGVARADIFAVFMWQAVLIGLIASSGALVASWFGTVYLNTVMANHWEELAKALEEMGGLFQLPLSIALMILGVVILICLLAAFLPSMRAAQKNPMDALRTQ